MLPALPLSGTARKFACCYSAGCLNFQPLACASTDGGGMKGMATVRLLRELERHTGKRIWELFDLIGKTPLGQVGSSSGLPL